jgi:hypothetical protein
MHHRWALKTLAVFAVTVCAVIHALSLPKWTPDPAVAALGSGYVSDSARVNGATLHYVRGGVGPGVILLHGFPEDWYAYRRIMPELANQSTVVAVDLRALGGCGKTRFSQGFEGFVKGHDFSRADEGNQINAGLQPLEMPMPANSSKTDFFRSLPGGFDTDWKRFWGSFANENPCWIKQRRQSPALQLTALMTACILTTYWPAR